MSSKFRAFSLPLIAVLVTSVLPGVSFSRAGSNQDIRIDVPAAARVRIDNPFGSISALVWKEKYVSVAANIEGGAAAFRRSPIVIDNRNQMLLISVVRTPLDPQVGISLIVKLPEGVHAEISTGAGAISIQGLPASASLKSVAGDVRADLPNPLDA